MQPLKSSPGMAIESVLTEPLVPRRRRLVTHGERVLCTTGWEPSLSEVGVTAGGSWQELSSPELVAESATAKCFRLQLPDGETIYFKRDRYSLRRGLGYFLRPSRNVVEAFAYGQLQSLHISAPELLAVAERRRFGIPSASCIVTRAVPDSMDLRTYLSAVWAQLCASQRRARFDELSALLVAQLQRAHAAGFFHHDLKWRNLLVQGAPGQLQLFWIDAPRAQRRRWRQRRGAVVDLSGLARVALSVTSKFQRMRFLRAYLGPQAAPGSATRLYRQIARHLARRPPKRFVLSYPADESC